MADSKLEYLQKGMRKDIAQLFNRSSNAESTSRSKTIDDAMLAINEYASAQVVLALEEVKNKQVEVGYKRGDGERIRASMVAVSDIDDVIMRYK